MTGDRDSFQLVQDPYVRVLYNKRGVSDYTLYDEAGIVERTGVPPVAVRAARRAAGRPLGQPPRRARGGGEDRGQAAHQVRRPRRDLRASRGADAQAPGEPGGERGAGPLQRPHHPARARRAARRGRRPPDPGRVGPHRGQGDLRSLRDEDGLAAHGGAPRRRRAGEPAGGGAGRGARVRRRRGRPPRLRRPPDRRSPPPPPWSCATWRCPRRRPRSRRSSASSAPARSRWPPAGTACPGAATSSRSCWWRPRARRPASASWCRASSWRRPRWSRRSTASWPVRSSATTSRSSCGRCCPLGIDLTGLEMDTAVAAYLLDASTGDYELAQLREQTGQLSLDIVEPGRGGAGHGPGGGGRGGRRLRHGDGLPPPPAVRGHGDAPRRHRDAARAGPGPDGGDRHPGRPGRAAGHRRLAQGVGRRPPEPRCTSAPATSSTSTRRRSCAPCSTTSSASTPGQEDQDRLLHRRPDPRDPARRPSHRRDAAVATARWRSCAPPTGRACWPRCSPTAASTPSFGQTVARTGRLSSDRPNLHNIPVRTEEGKRFRRAFVPAEGCRLPRGRLRPDRAAGASPTSRTTRG